MKSFGKYISKYLLSFVVFVIVLIFVNVLSYGWAFGSAITKDYGETSPTNMLERMIAASDADGTTDEMSRQLHNNQIWAMFLNPDGERTWSVDVPKEIPSTYTLQQVAVFSKGYLENYPVFVQTTDDGLLVLGYPKDSYSKLTSNYISIDLLRRMPVFFIGMLLFDFVLLFLAYYLSKKKIIKSTEPIIASVASLSEGKPTSLSIRGELADVAESVNKASCILSRQDEARANWISGISHDIRTPLSMIIGYAGRIADDEQASSFVREQAQIVQRQSLKIKELVQDLNLVSKLEYDMQPLHKKPVRLSKLLRTYVAELLNAGVPEAYSVYIEVDPDAEMIMLDCDERLISRAINNLVQNSIVHNAQGCHIKLLLHCQDTTVSLKVVDDGVGLRPDKIKELEEKQHNRQNTDDKLDLSHGLGLVLVRQIAEAHGGTMRIGNGQQYGYKTTVELLFTITSF